MTEITIKLDATSPDEQEIAKFEAHVAALDHVELEPAEIAKLRTGLADIDAQLAEFDFMSPILETNFKRFRKTAVKMGIVDRTITDLGTMRRWWHWQRRCADATRRLIALAVPTKAA
jgi:hypothetical protein